MNNKEFRKLLVKPGVKQDEVQKSDASQTERDEAPPKNKPLALGGRKSSMTPRALKTTESRQKHFKSTAPKGSTFATGYIDRAKARAQGEQAKDDKAERVAALEEQLKNEEISQKTFERLRDEIAGGNVSSTHLIKGLDRKLLERVRNGEDVLGLRKEPEIAADVDDELDKLEDVDVETVQKEKTVKQGVKAPAQLAGRKRTRDEIMADFKAQRKAAVEAQIAEEPALDSRWRSIDEKQKTRIEIDRKGREVLVIVDKDGTVTKKVRKVPKVEEKAMQLDPTKSVLGADVVVPEKPKVEALSDDEDIFEGAGTDYDPLGPDVDSDEDMKGVTAKPASIEHDKPRKMNYFKEEPSSNPEPSSDHLAGVRAVIEKAAKLAPSAEPQPEDDADAARRAKHAEMLANRDRDLDDMDMGFGASRYDDGEEAAEEGKKIRLSEWKGGKDDDEDEPENKRNHDKKKRKPKKRKGDANSFADIMNVIEGRKKGQ